MDENPVIRLVEQQEWLKPLGKTSDALVKGAVNAMGDAGGATKDALVNSRILGHKKHPTITDVPLGSWTVTLVSDLLEMGGQEPCATAADISVSVGLGASLLASLGGLADLSETHSQEERRLGMMHGIFHGVTILLYGGSLVARRAQRRGLGRALAFAGFSTLLTASYLANELVERRHGSNA
jgi:uncharacterized membrane protein